MPNDMKQQTNRSLIWLSLGLGLVLMTLSLAFPAQGIALQGTQAPTGQANNCAATPVITGKIVALELTVRAAPGQAAAIVLFVKKDDVVSVLGQDNNGDWLKIMTNAGVPGWGASPYIFVDKKKLANVPKLGSVAELAAAPAATASPTLAATMSPDCSPTATPAPINGVVVTTILTLRADPLGTSKAMGTVRKGDQVGVIAYNASETWLKISSGNAVGWVSSAYVFVDKAHLLLIPHDYTSVEVTLTPTSQ